MARSVRAVSSPRGGPIQIGTGHTFRMQSGSMGAPAAPMVSDEPLGVADKFEVTQQDDANWQAEIRRREMSAGLPPVSAPAAKVEPFWGTASTAASVAPPPIPVDLTDLPDHFTLEVQRKGDGWWIVRAPTSHVGLFVAHQNLIDALSDAPGALAQILRLDGPVPEIKRRRTK